MFDRQSRHEFCAFNNLCHTLNLLINGHRKVNAHRTRANCLVNVVVGQVADEDEDDMAFKAKQKQEQLAKKQALEALKGKKGGPVQGGIKKSGKK